MMFPIQLPSSLDVRYVIAPDFSGELTLFIVFPEPEMEELYSLLSELESKGVECTPASYSQYYNAIAISINKV